MRAEEKSSAFFIKALRQFFDAQARSARAHKRAGLSVCSDRTIDLAFGRIIFANTFKNPLRFLYASRKLVHIHRKKPRRDCIASHRSDCSFFRFFRFFIAAADQINPCVAKCGDHTRDRSTHGTIRADHRNRLYLHITLSVASRRLCDFSVFFPDFMLHHQHPRHQRAFYNARKDRPGAKQNTKRF